MQAVRIGFGNVINAKRIVAIIQPNATPAKRLIQDARNKGLLLDLSYGRKTKSAIVLDDEHIILAAVGSETIADRIRQTNAKASAHTP